MVATDVHEPLHQHNAAPRINSEASMWIAFAMQATDTRRSSILRLGVGEQDNIQQPFRQALEWAKHATAFTAWVPRGIGNSARTAFTEDAGKNKSESALPLADHERCHLRTRHVLAGARESRVTQPRGVGPSLAQGASVAPVAPFATLTDLAWLALAQISAPLGPAALQLNLDLPVSSASLHIARMSSGA